MIFTSLPPLAIGIFDQNLSSKSILVNPKVYQAGISKSYFTLSRFWAFVLDGMFCAAVCFMVTIYTFENDIASDGKTSTLTHTGTTAAIYCITIVVLFTAFNIKLWTVIPLIAVLFSILSAIAFTIFMSSVNISMNLQGLAPVIFKELRFWLGLFLLSCICFIPRAAYRLYQIMEHPSNHDIVREINYIEQKNLKTLRTN